MAETTSRLRLAITICAALALPVGVMSAGPANAFGSSSEKEEAKSAAEIYQEGVEAMKEGKYRRAERRFREVLRELPDDPAANYMMGVAKMKREKFADAIPYLEKAVKAEKGFVEARLALGQAYVKTGDKANAEAQTAYLRDLYEKCLEAGDDCDETKRGKLKMALEEMEKLLNGTKEGALSTDRLIQQAALDNHGTAYHGAVRLINKGKFEEAIGALREAALMTGPHPDIQNYLGFAHRKLGRFDEARGYYAAALSLDPEHKGAHEYLGELYIQTGELDKAKAQLAKLGQFCSFGCAEREALARAITNYENAHASLN